MILHVFCYFLCLAFRAPISPDTWNLVAAAFVALPASVAAAGEPLTFVLGVGGLLLLQNERALQLEVSRRAALEAARIRLRPILMTSLAFIFGVLPLAISTGAGANSRIAIGTSVIGGMLTATILAIFYIPLFFILVRRGWRRHRGHGAPPPAAAGQEELA